MVLDLRPAISFGNTGTCFGWWLAWESTKGFYLIFPGGDAGITNVPKHFNLVVDAVVRHWLSLVAGGAGVQYGWIMEVWHHIDFLYEDDGLFILMETVWL